MQRTMPLQTWLRYHFCTLFLLLIIHHNLFSHALHADEAGIIDFTIATTGHGHVTNAHFTPTSVITAGATNCDVASRNITTGDILWTRNGCGSSLSSSSAVSVALLTGGDDGAAVVVSLDKKGVLRRWRESDGALLEDVSLGEGAWLALDGQEIVVPSENILKSIKKGDVGGSADLIEIILDVSADFVLAGWVDKDSGLTTLGQLGVAKMTENEIEKVRTVKGGSSNVPVLAKSLKIWSEKRGIVGLTADHDLIVWTEERGASVINSLQTEIGSLTKVTPDGLYLNVVGKKDGIPIPMASLLTMANNGQLTPMEMSSAVGPATAIGTCQSDSTTTIYSVHSSGDNYILCQTTATKITTSPLSLSSSQHGTITHVFPDCASATTAGTNILLSTSSFTTHLHSPYSSWTAEESLSSITQSIFFDYSTPSTTPKQKLFGLHKGILLLSSSAGKMFGVDTLGPQKGEVLYTALLPQDATRHVLVNGGSSSASGVHGAFSGVGVKKSHEVLVLSIYEGDRVEWRMIDTLSGDFIDAESKDNNLALTGKILNVVPLQGNELSQMALVLYQKGDNEYDFEIVPPTESSYSDLAKLIGKSAKNGFFVHSIIKPTGEISSFHLSLANNDSSNPTKESIKLDLIGQLTFPPSSEIITAVHYPPRGEVIQSPTTILGDDSLLLKYLNPHLAVVITEATPSQLETLEADPSPFMSLQKKPQGVSSEPPPPPSPPTLFVNLIDTTTAKVLHRMSHIHKTSSSDSATYVPLTISENWILYSYFNQKTKRTDVAVLTLYEGMIDKSSLSLFKSPDQEPTFSTFSSPSPIVLHKVYTYPKAVHGLGVTRTARGISTKNFILATSGGVVSVDARFLDPRRPSGELKKSEKAEGLGKYHPVIPHMPMKVLNHVRELGVRDGVRVITASTNVESQSLVWVFGGRDLFFTRLAPSKGFDLLPENFNKGALGVVVLALLVGYGVLRKVCTDKLLQVQWA